MNTEGRDNTSHDIARIQGEILLRTTETPKENRELRDEQERARTIPNDPLKNKNTATILGTPEKIGRSNPSSLHGKQNQILRKLRSLLQKIPDKYFDRGTSENRAESSRFLQKAKLLEMHLVKINKPKLGIYQQNQKAGIKLQEENPPHLQTLIRDVLTSARQEMKTF